MRRQHSAHEEPRRLREQPDVPPQPRAPRADYGPRSLGSSGQARPSAPPGAPTLAYRRPPTPADIPAISALAKREPDVLPPPDAVRAAIKAGRQFVVEHNDGTIIASARIYTISPGILELGGAVVAPDHRRRGHHRDLVAVRLRAVPRGVVVVCLAIVQSASYRGLVKSGWRPFEGQVPEAIFDPCSSCSIEALPTAPSARVALDHILELFRVETKAGSLGVVGTPQHLAMRNGQSKTALDALRAWAKVERPLREPTSNMGRALAYLENQWEPLTAFLGDARSRLTTTRRGWPFAIIALARKNSLFFGSADAAHKQMVLFSLIATCTTHGANPRAHIADLLIRIQDTKASEVHTLLPGAWKERFGSGFDRPSDDDEHPFGPPVDAV